MISAYLAAFGQLGDPRIRGVIWRVALWTAITFGLLAWGLIEAVSSYDPTATFDFIPFAWLASGLAWIVNTLVAMIGGFIFLVVLWLLFAAIVQFYTSFYLERVVAAIEARHYPGLPAPRAAGIAETVMATVRFFVAMVLINLVAIPIYLIPMVGVAVFFAINGYLLGREYFEMVALRRVSARAMRALRRRHRGRLMTAGLIATFILWLPVVNLVAPILAAAATVHLYHAMGAGAGTTAEKPA